MSNQKPTISYRPSYLVNTFRLVAISLLAALVGGLPTILVHEYLFTLIIVAWFFLFWWFSYSFVLEEVKTEAPMGK